MKTRIILFLLVLSVVAAGSLGLWSLIEVRKAEADGPPDCPSCEVECIKEGEDDCHLEGRFCLLEDTYYFWYKRGDAEEFLRVSMPPSLSVVCEDDCLGYELSENPTVTCGWYYDWHVNTSPSNDPMVPWTCDDRATCPD